MRPQCLLRASVRTARQDFERAALLAAKVAASWSHRRHGTPVTLSRASGSRQFGRASAPTSPHRVHTMRGPNVGTGTSSDHGSALRIARRWHCQHDTSSDRTPFGAAAADVTAMGLSGSAAGGAWEIPTAGVSQLHAGETVLPPAAAEGFRNMAEGGGPFGGAGGETHIHIPTIDAAGVQ